MKKTTDKEGLYPPPEEDPTAKKKDKTVNIRVVPVKKDDKAVYIGDEYDINNKSKSYWSKFNVAMIDKILDDLGEKVEKDVKVNGKFAKKRVDRINKEAKISILLQPG